MASSTLESFPAGRPLPVDPEVIESELAALWQSISGEKDGGAGGVTRTCLSNLILWKPESGQPGRLPEMIRRVVGHHPCRVMLMEIDPNAGALEAGAGLHCARGLGAGRQVCCEQITIRAGAGAEAHLPGLAATLSISTLPSFVVMNKPDDLEDPALAKLARTADMIIVDSAFAGPPGIEAMARLDADSKSCALADLNWRRLRPWQDMIAAFFDGPAFRPAIPRLERIEISGADDAGSTALLMAGWVMAALNGRRLDFDYRMDGSAPAGTIITATLAAGPPDPIRFSVELDAGQALLTGSVARQGSCPLPRRLPYVQPEPWQVLCGLLERAEANPLFRKALELAAALPEA